MKITKISRQTAEIILMMATTPVESQSKEKKCRKERQNNSDNEPISE